MPRRRRRPKRSQADVINDLTENIQSQLGGSPLSEVGEKLLEAVQWLLFSNNEHVDWTRIHRDVTEFLQRLPVEFNLRFHFDAYLVHSVRDRWNEGAAILPSMLIPVSRQEWCYQRVSIPVTQDEEIHLIGISNRPDGSREPPFLLDYPFLFHELGHVHLERCEQRFKKRFEEALQAVLNQQARRRLPLRDRARVRSESRSEEIEEHWSVGHQGMWSFELTIDVVALWTCGPAYLDTLTHYLQEHYHDKFQIEPSHPPAALRGAVLAQAARRLHWADYVGELESIVDDWMDKGPPSFNRYRALTDDRIVDACLVAAFDYCTWAQIPRLAPEDLSRIQARIEQKEELTGTDLIVAAWLVDYEQGAEAYDKWEQKVFEQFVEELEAGL